MWRRRAGRARPWWRTLADVVVLIAAIAMVISAMRVTGILTSETGNARAIDGDSLRIGEKEFRLHGIDAPELNQTCSDGQGDEWPCGRDARELLRNLVRGNQTKCVPVDTDRYGRIVADCSVHELSLNGEMVRQGFAVAYIRHSRRHETLERQAR
ncbi:MAG: thermonuclease family protein, partial [Rhizobiales bacterium]|nr:thermonuclease family protein [Hyphomicrobiales bacterium]